MTMKSFLAGLFLMTVVALPFAIAQASGTPAPMSKAPNAAPVFTDILPTQKTTDPQAAKIAGVLLKNDIKLYADPKTGFFLAANFFNAPTLPKNSFVIAKFEGPDYCGTMGCMTYFLKMTDPKKNAWKIIYQSNFNEIMTSDKVLAREPSFYTKGTGLSPYSLYNAATEKYESGR